MNNKFTSYEIQPCVIEYEEDEIEYVIPAPTDGTPTFWGLYGRLPGGLAEWIADYDTEEEAIAALAKYRGTP
jgi:hypothetical protein